jgi:hypothetical protein
MSDIHHVYNIFHILSSLTRTTYKQPYIGGNNRASRALNKLSMHVFVIKDGIFSFFSLGNKLLINSNIEIPCLISYSSRHLSTKLVVYFVFCFIAYYNNRHEDLRVFVFPMPAPTSFTKRRKLHLWSN